MDDAEPDADVEPAGQQPREGTPVSSNRCHYRVGACRVTVQCMPLLGQKACMYWSAYIMSNLDNWAGVLHTLQDSE